MSKRPPITQIDSGSLGTWAISRTDTGRALYALQNGNWTYIGGSVVVTVGKSGIWQANSKKKVFFRMRVTSTQPLGSNWRQTSGEQFIQIDSGSSGVIYAVNRCDFVLSILSLLAHFLFFLFLDKANQNECYKEAMIFWLEQATAMPFRLRQKFTSNQCKNKSKELLRLLA